MVLKERLDTLLLKRGLFTSRNKAQSAILSGLVKVAGSIVDKPGAKFATDEKIVVKETQKFVSRGGNKLERAADTFKLEISGKVFLDVGASTGGFTDLLLKRGAKKVIALDVGYGQLAWNLRNDPRVQVLERSNIRYVKIDQLSEKPDTAVVDLSFISVVKIMPNLLTLIKQDAEIIVLIKPQFEIGKGKVGKGGIVSNASDHKEVLTSLWKSFTEMGLRLVGLTYSPIKGADGNIEFFMHLKQNKRKEESEEEIEAEVDRVVKEAYSALLPKEHKT